MRNLNFIFFKFILRKYYMKKKLGQQRERIALEMKFLRAILNKIKKGRIRNTNIFGSRNGRDGKRNSKDQIKMEWACGMDERRKDTFVTFVV